MKLTKRGSVYVADLRKLGGSRVSLHTSDLEEAKRKYLEAVQALGQVQKVAKAAKPTVTLGTAYRSLHAGGDWGDAKDKRGIGTRWKMVREFFGDDVPLAGIDREKLEQFVQYMREQRDGTGGQRYAPNTIHKHLALVSKILRSAAIKGQIAGMPMIPWPKVKKGGRIRWYTPEEEQQIIAWYRGKGWAEMAALTEFLIDSGFRRGEAIGPYRVVGDYAVLDDQKNGAQTMTRLTTRALQAAKAKPWAGLSESMIDKRWEAMRNALGLGSGANVHACRHTTATRLAQARLPIKAIQKFMRHSCETTTLIYIHLVDGSDLSAIETLESVSKGVPKVCQKEADVGTKLAQPS